MCCTVALGVLPVTGRVSATASAAAVGPEREETVAAAPGKLVFPSYSLGRDPFVPAVSEASRTEAADPTPSGPIVRAIVTGSQPRALIEIGGSVRMIAVGDRVGEAIVLSIDSEGVSLSGSVRLPIAADHQ